MNKIYKNIHHSLTDQHEMIDAILEREFDAYIVQEIEQNPDCKEFISSKELYKKLNINELELQ